MFDNQNSVLHFTIFIKGNKPKINCITDEINSSKHDEVLVKLYGYVLGLCTHTRLGGDGLSCTSISSLHLFETSIISVERSFETLFEFTLLVTL